MTNWTIASVSPTVRPFEARITAAIDAVHSRVAAISGPQSVAFTLKADRTRAIPRFGFGGSCYEPHAITLAFDTRNPNVDAHLDETLERTIAHKYHHALRWAGPGYGAKLGAALESEGSAGHFGLGEHVEGPRARRRSRTGGPRTARVWRRALCRCQRSHAK